jgi:hypothetical protein
VGHDHAGGAGSTAAATKFGQGSSTTMEQTRAVKSGITMGHDWASGPGSFAATQSGTQTYVSKPGGAL